MNDNQDFGPIRCEECNKPIGDVGLSRFVGLKARHYHMLCADVETWNLAAASANRPKPNPEVLTQEELEFLQQRAAKL